MKKLLLIAAMVAAPAFADNEMAYIDNEAGGSILFTYSRCVYVRTQKVVPNHYYVYTTDPYGNKIGEGCYEYKYPFYIVEWNGGKKLSVHISKVQVIK